MNAPTDHLTVPVQPAATVMLVRDCTDHDDLEVFLLRRNFGSVFGGGMYVFPGGRVDPSDQLVSAAVQSSGLTDAAASQVLGLDRGGLAYWVAALRECFEEAGVLLARSIATGTEVHFGDSATHERYTIARHLIHAGSVSLAEFCQAEGLRLMTNEVRYVSHWATPLGGPRRFNTRFFLARNPDGQQPLHDHGETVESRWIRPKVALELERSGDLEMMTPTIASLQFLAQFRSAIGAMRSSARFQGDISSLAL